MTWKLLQHDVACSSSVVEVHAGRDRLSRVKGILAQKKYENDSKPIFHMPIYKIQMLIWCYFSVNAHRDGNLTVVAAAALSEHQ